MPLFISSYLSFSTPNSLKIISEQAINFIKDSPVVVTYFHKYLLTPCWSVVSSVVPTYLHRYFNYTMTMNSIKTVLAPEILTLWTSINPTPPFPPLRPAHLPSGRAHLLFTEAPSAPTKTSPTCPPTPTSIPKSKNSNSFLQSQFFLTKGLLDSLESLGRSGEDDTLGQRVRPFDRVESSFDLDNITISLCLLTSKTHFLSRKKRNSLIHSLNGNLKKFKRFSDIYFQNIPGIKNVLDVQISLDLLLSKKPAMLAIGEIPHHKLSQCHFPGYHILPGKQLNSKKVRLNLLVKDGLEYQELDLTSEIPTCTVRYAGWNCVFIYREWMKCGDSRTRHLPMQNDRWDTFLPKWLALKGKTMLMGDLNFCCKNTTSTYQKKFDHIRDSILDNFLLQGWMQIVDDETRFQKNNPPSLLDQIYLNDSQYIERVYNVPYVDSDHNTIGVRIRHDGPVHQPVKFQKRNIKGIDQETFSSYYLSSNLWEIFQETDVDTAVFKLIIILQCILDTLAPLRTITIGQKQMPWMTEELQQSLEHRNLLHRIAQTTGNQEDWDVYKLRRNQLRAKMRKAKNQYTKDYLKVEDVSNRWTRVKTFAGLDQNRRNVVMEVQTDQGMTKSRKVLSQFMNRYFSDKVDNLKSKTSPNLLKSLS